MYLNAFDLIDVNYKIRYSDVTIQNEHLKYLLPGPVTLVFDRKPILPKELNPNTSSIGIRIPDHKFMIELSKYCDEPIALTSANISNQQSSLQIKARNNYFLLIKIKMLLLY